MEKMTASAGQRETYLKNVNDALGRIARHKGVIGYIVMDPASSKVLRSSGFGENPREVRRYVEKLRGFIDLADSTVRMIDWQDQMTFLRVSYGAFDILVAPDLEKQYTLVVIQHIE